MELRALGTRSRAQRRGLGVGRSPKSGRGHLRLERDSSTWPGSENTGHTESPGQRSADRDAV